jgi:uncharacterized protein YndB with AHSA1/START domain
MATVDTHIAASPDDVFRLLADGWTYPQWVVGTSHMRAVDESWPAVGAKLYHATGVWPAVIRDHTRVDDVIAGEKIVMTARGYPFGQAEVELTLSAEDGGTRVVMREEPTGRGAFLLRNPIVDAALTRRNIETLVRLRVLAERPTRPAPDE